MKPTKSTLIALLAAFTNGIIARNVIGASCIDGPCADGSCCNGGWTDEKCGGGCTSGPCVESNWQDIDCAVAEDTESSGNVIWSDSQTNFVFEEALNSWLGASGIGLQRLYGEDGTGTSLTFTEYIIWNWYDQLSRSATAVSLDMSTFSDTFAPIPNEGLGLTLILDMVTLGYAAVAAPMWKSVFKKQDWFNNPDNFATVEGLTKDLISTGSTITKDVTKTGTKLSSQNTLDVRVGAMIETWHAAADSLNQHVFSGDPLGLNDNLDLLKNLIMDGKFAGSDLDLLSAEELDGQIKKAIYGQLIPYAWSVGSSEVYPLAPLTGASRTRAKRRASTLWGTFGSSTCVFEDPFTGYKCYDYQAPPDIDELDGTKWGGVTQDDIVVAAYNKHLRPEESDITSDEMISRLSESNMRAAGLVGFSVCSTEEAHNNWGRFAQGYGKSDNYPCN
ncbi:hypothetical protein QQX98_010775 [Neonectria punicea]|uniref:Chitinase n=1 Tax=Neonectria punicea TaxID=979145 RepID=A0ABR1GNN7_9HYPO